MRFEGRDLKPYAVEVRAADLVVGHPYFRVGYLDDDLLVPHLEALVFLGRDLNPEGPGLYFQDAESFLGGATCDIGSLPPLPPQDAPDHDHLTFEMADDVWVDVYPTGDSVHVQAFDEALESLLECSLRWPKWDGVLRPAGPPSGADT